MTKMIKNCHISDTSDFFNFIIWDEKIEQIKKNAAYKVHDAVVSSFNDKYVSAIGETSIPISTKIIPKINRPNFMATAKFPADSIDAAKKNYSCIRCYSFKKEIATMYI